MKRREFVTLMIGGAASWPRAGRAQQQAMPVIGFLRQGAPEPATLTIAFKQGLSETGISVGRDVAIENRWAEGRYDRLPALASELVSRPSIAVIAAAFLPAALAAKAATQTIPIVFLSGSDPIDAGLVSSFNRPTENVTGVAAMFTLLGGKNLELLHELVPTVTVIGALAKSSNPNAKPQLTVLQAAAHSLGLELVVFGVDNEQEIDTSFATMVQQPIGALVVTADGFFISQRDQIVALASRYRVPTIYPNSQFVAVGGLMSSGASLSDAYRLTGVYVGKILKGAKPADLPVVQPTRIELVINLKTAKALGLNVPATLLATADELIE